MLIIRRLNCIDAASGIVTLSKWPSGAQVERTAEPHFYVIRTLSVLSFLGRLCEFLRNREL